MNKNDAQPDSIKCPSHYCINGYECRKVIEAIGLFENFYVAMAFRYLWRCMHKGTFRADLKKAREFINFELELLEKEKNNE